MTLKQKAGAINEKELRLFLERDAHAVVPEGCILIFIKFYDPEHKKLTLVGHIFGKLSETMDYHIPMISSLLKFDGPTPIRIYEVQSHFLLWFKEIKPTMVEQRKGKATLISSELSSGDILVVQKELTLEQ